MGFIGKQPSKAAITSSDITDGVVTADKLASDSVTTAKIADNGVTTAKINADAVTDAKIADDVVGSEHLTAGEVDTTALGADAVTAAKIADDAISDEHLDPTAITGQTAETSVADDDLVLISDTSASAALKKMTVSNLVANAGGGKVLQVVLATKTDAFTTTNTSSHQATGLTVNITPSATSSKVLILVNGMCGNTVDGEHAAITIKRDSTNLAGGSADLTRFSGNGRKAPTQLQFLDSPSSTSQIAYGVFMYTSGGGSTSSFNGDSLYAHILAIEIGA